MPEIPPLAGHKDLRPAETALVLNLVSETDLLRLKAIARLHARGLPPDVSWEDLLQEAFTRIITGSRVQPEGLNVIAFLAGIMRSLKAEHWRRVGREISAAQLRNESAAEHAREIALSNQASDPERALIVQEEIHALERQFAGDTVALRILSGLAQGFSAEEIRSQHQMSKTAYDSARKRIRRSLLREGLTCGEK